MYKGYLTPGFGVVSLLRSCWDFFVGPAVEGEPLTALALENGAPGAPFLFGA